MELTECLGARVFTGGGGGRGWGGTLTFACYPNYFLVQTFEFRNVFSVEVFFPTSLLVRMPI